MLCFRMRAESLHETWLCNLFFFLLNHCCNCLLPNSFSVSPLKKTFLIKCGQCRLWNKILVPGLKETFVFQGNLGGWGWFYFFQFHWNPLLICLAIDGPRPLQNAPFCPISVSGSNFNPQNTQCIPAVEIFAFLELEQNWTFFKGLGPYYREHFLLYYSNGKTLNLCFVRTSILRN